MRNPIIFSLLAFAFLAACSMSSDQPASDLRVNPLDPDGTPSPQTDPAIRIADALQEAKQTYDDGHYASAMRWAQTAQNLIIEHQYPTSDLAIAINIQGYCLLQAGQMEDYYVAPEGKVEGALTKFKKVLELVPRDFRARLGTGLANFRLHSHMVAKADTLGQGALALDSIQYDLVKASGERDSAARAELLRDAHRRFKTFAANRERILEMRGVFKDVSKNPKFNEDRERDAPWLGNIQEGVESMKVLDVGNTLESAIEAGELDASLHRGVAKDLSAISENWRHVRDYWRRSALTRLQTSRDQFLVLYKERPDYFWVERDLAFVYQSFGAFFLDESLDKAQAHAIKAGTRPDRLEAETRRIFLSKEFTLWEKEESRKNYADALRFIKAFIVSHRNFEMKRERARDKVDFNDQNSNPFLVDLVSRYRQTMIELITEERNMRASMILEGAVLCIEPLFQNKDTPLGVRFADDLKALQPGNPIHHLVKATAYFQDADYEKAKLSYQAYLQESSVTQDLPRRTLARERIRQCESNLRREAGAGESR